MTTFPGKNFPGQKGFPTPNDIPQDGGYVVFRIPKDNEWAGLILGAAEALAKEYNWFQWGDMTPAEAAEALSKIVSEAPYNNCGCSLPGGRKIIRLNPDSGRVEELGEDGEWGEPTGDYEIPAIPPRTGSDPVCLAAANCANVLSLLYEEISDSFGEQLSEADAYANFVAFLITVLGAAFAPITWALAAFFWLAWRVLYETIEFVSADLWTSDFTQNLICILLDCANDDAGVITFDYNCFNEKLAAQTDLFSLNFDQLRLFGQIQYILSIVGGADALNTMGATTAISEYDCSYCGEDCDSYLGGDDGISAWDLLFGTYNAGLDVVEGAQNGSLSAIAMWIDAPVGLARIALVSTRSSQSSNGNVNFYAIRNDDPDDFVLLHSFTNLANGTEQLEWAGFTMPAGYDQLLINGQAVGAAATLTFDEIALCL